VPGLAAGMEAAGREIRREAQARVMELRAEAAVARELKTAPPGVGKLPGPDGIPGPPPGDDSGISFNDKPWDAKTNPLVVSWLPDAANARLNGWIGRAKANAERLEESGDGNPLMRKFLGLLPQTLFLMLPMFALLLKAMYFFKRRLYMEHLVVALHSHAFLCLGLLLQFLLLLLEEALAGAGGFVLGLLDWIEVALWVWMPLYLLLMQKRVYRQGWIATALKFGVVGLVYTMLLGVALLATMLISLVNM
jgi:hypothetical protein